MLSPRGQSGLEAKILALALWPQPRSFGFGLALVSLSYYVIGHLSCKNCVKLGNFVNFSGNNLKSYVVNHYLVIFYNYFWPRPRPHSPGLGHVALASASRFWPRLTSLHKMSCIQQLMLPTYYYYYYYHYWHMTTQLQYADTLRYNPKLQRTCHLFSEWLTCLRSPWVLHFSFLVSHYLHSYLEPLRTEDVIPINYWCWHYCYCYTTTFNFCWAKFTKCSECPPETKSH